MRRAAILPAAFTLACALALTLATPLLHAQTRYLARAAGTFRATIATHVDISRDIASRTVIYDSPLSIQSHGIVHFTPRLPRVSEAVVRPMPVDTRRPHVRLEYDAMACSCPIATLVSMELVLPSRFDAMNREIPLRAPRPNGEERLDWLKEWMTPPAMIVTPSARIEHPLCRLIDDDRLSGEKTPERKSRLDGSHHDIHSSGNHLAVEEVQVISSGFNVEYGDILCGCICIHNGCHPSHDAPDQRAEPAPAPPPAVTSNPAPERPTIE